MLLALGLIMPLCLLRRYLDHQRHLTIAHDTYLHINDLAAGIRSHTYVMCILRSFSPETAILTVDLGLEQPRPS